MSIRQPIPATLLLVSWWIACSAALADPGLDDCSDVVDDAERLACYDRVARQPDAGGHAADDTTPATPDTAPAAADVAPAAAGAAAVAAAASGNEAGAGQAADSGEKAVQAEADFGVEPRMQRNDDAETKLRQIYATVVSIDQTKSGKRIFTLDNGQVWLEQSSSRRLKLKPGESIRIKAGSFGSYKLFGDGKVSTKVERVR